MTCPHDQLAGAGHAITCQRCFASILHWRETKPMFWFSPKAHVLDTENLEAHKKTATHEYLMRSVN